MFDVRFRCPSTTLVSGPSQSGKTSLVLNILNRGNQYFRDPRCLQNILFYYKEWQPKYGEFDAALKIQFINAVPTAAEVREKTAMFQSHGGSLIIIDDLMQDVTQDVSVLFTAQSHHLNITVFLLTQNLFPKNSNFRDISLNATYLILFKNPRDVSQISNFARQYAPGKSKLITDVYRQATAEPHSHILFDNHQHTPDIVRIRSNIIPNDSPMEVWAEHTCI
jgi:hypothetical protein